MIGYMHNIKKQLSVKFGILSIIVLTSGCAVNHNPDPYAFDNPLTIDPPRGPILSDYDLNNFDLDCSREQVQFLQGMRRTNVERQKATFGGLFKEYSLSKPSKRTNWIINQKLMRCRGYGTNYPTTAWGYEYYNNRVRDNKLEGEAIRKQRMQEFENRNWN